MLYLDGKVWLIFVMEYGLYYQDLKEFLLKTNLEVHIEQLRKIVPWSSSLTSTGQTKWIHDT
jgi:hypothetical protein